MAIETTIIINHENYQIIHDLSSVYKTSKSKIIAHIITLLSNTDARLINNNFTTAYQRKHRNNYKRMHIYISEPVFSVALDLRHFYRSSFSLLIAIILKKYYRKLLTLLGDTDNYTHQVHCKIYIFDSETKCFKHYWGIPEEIELETG